MTESFISQGITHTYVICPIMRLFYVIKDSPAQGNKCFVPYPHFMRF